MKRIAAIVEGYGDKDAIPHLLAKMGDHLDYPVCAPNPIRVGEWKKVRRPGELERALELALSREYDEILVILDLDDGCAAEQYSQSIERVFTWKNGRDIKVSVVFLVKEYESIFLTCADEFSKDTDEVDDIIAHSETIRDAKGTLKRLTGRRYKETQDQVEYTKRVSIASLLLRSRSFRKLAKDVTGLNYQMLDCL